MAPQPFSLFTLFTAGLAFLVPLTTAFTTPTGDKPKGNPLSAPGLHSVVPAGKGYTVTWKPTTPGTVSLLLLKGPSNNAVPQYAIAEGIKNTGTYEWTPDWSLQPSEKDKGYGIQLIDDATGQYQYTTQFGISNPNWNPNMAYPSGVWGPNQGHPHGPPGSWPTNSVGNWASPPGNMTGSPPTASAKPYRNQTTSAVSMHPAQTSAPAKPWNNSTRPANATASATAPRHTNEAAGMAASIGSIAMAAAVAAFAL